MGLSVRAVAPASQVLARLHRWYPAAWLLSQVPLPALDRDSVGRLRYCLMLANRSQAAATRALFDRVLRMNRDVSPALQLELAAMAVALEQPATAETLLEGAAEAPATADVAGKLLRVLQSSVAGTLHSGLIGQVAALGLPPSGAVTLVPVSGRYLDLWHLWLGQVERHLHGTVVVMVMDDTSVEALSGRAGVALLDVRSYFSWDSAGRIEPHTRGVLWYLRVLVLQALVQQGHATLVLDLDAIPVGDVQPLLAALPGADVVAQQDHSLPRDVDRQLGFVLCCGFMLWRPTAASLSLLDRFAQASAVERDDQLALNHILGLEGIQSQPADDTAMHFESAGVHFACPSQALVSRDLNTGSVVRHFHQTGQSLPQLRAALGIATS